MTYKTLLFLIILPVVFSFSSKKGNEVPPGTTQINDTLFFDKTEISNSTWLEYMAWNKNKFGINSNEYKFSCPDTLVWRDPNSCNEPYVQYYLRHPAYNNYPVVGVSYDQALEYCKWRSDRVNLFLMVKSGKMKIENAININSIEKRFEYRLPTKQEWESIALLGLSDQSRKTIKAGKATIGMFNVRDIMNDTINHHRDVCYPVDSHYENILGVRHMIGNVSEMIQEKGICKGGSWRSMLKDSHPSIDNKYQKPSAMLGFRCVAIRVKS